MFVQEAERQHAETEQHVRKIRENIEHHRSPIADLVPSKAAPAQARPLVKQPSAQLPVKVAAVQSQPAQQQAKPAVAREEVSITACIDAVIVFDAACRRTKAKRTVRTRCPFTRR